MDKSKDYKGYKFVQYFGDRAVTGGICSCDVCHLFCTDLCGEAPCAGGYFTKKSPIDKVVDDTYLPQSGKEVFKPMDLGSNHMVARALAVDYAKRGFKDDSEE